MNLKRTLAGSATVLLALSLSACGGGDGSSAPDDASAEEFCDGYNGQLEAMSDLDPNASEEEQGKAMLDGLKKWADEMSDIGTPEDMADDARDGFELMVGTISDLDADDIANLEDLEDEFSEDDKKAATAFQEYVTDNCESASDDVPSDVPTD